jgi:hypothetical protein
VKIIRDYVERAGIVDDCGLSEEYGREAGYFVFERGLVGFYGQVTSKPDRPDYFLLMLVFVAGGLVYRRNVELGMIGIDEDDSICRHCAEAFIESIPEAIEVR